MTSYSQLQNLLLISGDLWNLSPSCLRGVATCGGTATMTFDPQTKSLSGAIHFSGIAARGGGPATGNPSLLYGDNFYGEHTLPLSGLQLPAQVAAIRAKGPLTLAVDFTAPHSATKADVSYDMVLTGVPSNPKGNVMGPCSFYPKMVDVRILLDVQPNHSVFFEGFAHGGSFKTLTTINGKTTDSAWQYYAGGGGGGCFVPGGPNYLLVVLSFPPTAENGLAVSFDLADMLGKIDKQRRVINLSDLYLNQIRLGTEFWEDTAGDVNFNWKINSFTITTP